MLKKEQAVVETVKVIEEAIKTSLKEIITVNHDFEEWGEQITWKSEEKGVNFTDKSTIEITEDAEDAVYVLYAENSNVFQNDTDELKGYIFPKFEGENRCVSFKKAVSEGICGTLIVRGKRATRWVVDYRGDISEKGSWPSGGQEQNLVQRVKYMVW